MDQLGEEITAYEQALTERALERIADLDGVALTASRREGRTPTFALTGGFFEAAATLVLGTEAAAGAR